MRALVAGRQVALRQDGHHLLGTHAPDWHRSAQSAAGCRRPGGLVPRRDGAILVRALLPGQGGHQRPGPCDCHQPRRLDPRMPRGREPARSHGARRCKGEATCSCARLVVARGADTLSACLAGPIFTRRRRIHRPSAHGRGRRPAVRPGGRQPDVRLPPLATPTTPLLPLYPDPQAPALGPGTESMLRSELAACLAGPAAVWLEAELGHLLDRSAPCPLPFPAPCDSLNPAPLAATGSRCSCRFHRWSRRSRCWQRPSSAASW